MTQKKIIIVYYSKTGNTKKTAELIAQGASKNALVSLKSSDEATNQDLLDSDCIVFGSPTYFRLPAWPLKRFIDRMDIYEDLEGKRGAVFTTCEDPESGPFCIEALRNVLEECDIEIIGKGLVVKEAPDEEEAKRCVEYGKLIASSI